MGTDLQLSIALSASGSRHRRRDLHDQLRDAILDGRLGSGLQLPATRQLAGALGVSRNTVLAAYEMLLSEGYLEARAGAGTFVSGALPRRRAAAGPEAQGGDSRLGAAWREVASPFAPSNASAEFDFRLGVPDKTRFPFETWRRLSNRALRELGRAPARYLDPAGQVALREAIASHVSFARAVACEPQDVLVTNGAQQAFDLIARILVTPGETVVATEEPGYPPMRAAFELAGAIVRPCRVDEQGLVVSELPSGTRIICVTPSHQFPLGVAMSHHRRGALLDFAADHKAVVVEDDYDGEFRFGGRPLDALQTIDAHQSVFYVGTFSKSLFPALRLGFLIPPLWARQALVTARQFSDWHGPALSQETLAAFIREGHLARHVRRMTKVYGARRAALLEALSKQFGDLLVPLPSLAGLHLAARLSPRVDIEAGIARAAAAGVAIENLGRYALTGGGIRGLAFGYGAIEADQIEAAVARLAGAMVPRPDGTSRER